MALFEVPGWSVPSAPVPAPSTSKKRKRDKSDTEKVSAAEVNVEKLIAKLGNEEKGAPKKKAKVKPRARTQEQDNAIKFQPSPKAESKPKQKPVKGRQQPDEPPSVEEPKGLGKQLKKKRKLEQSTSPSKSKSESNSTSAEETNNLTPLQANMKHSLDGARFRWINEMLYKSDSHKAHGLMKENTNVFSEYHSGFRHQVQSWPSNPVAHYISILSKYPQKTVIADLGCGDAALAQALVPKGLNVLSFDLVSDDNYVIEADICTKIPLPGSEADGEGGNAALVDIVICALSLMGTNWPICIREARRILKDGGELKIAEVASRFTNTEAFVSLITSIGFKLRSKDDSNTHFTLFEFTKVKRKQKSDKDWAKILEQGCLLKPCEYKRR